MKRKNILIAAIAVIVVLLGVASVRAYDHHKAKQQAHDAAVAAAALLAAERQAQAQQNALLGIQAQAAHYRAACLAVAAKTRQPASLCN